MSEYAIRIERNGGSMEGEVVAVFATLDEARDYIDIPPAWLGGAVLSIYNLTPCGED